MDDQQPIHWELSLTSDRALEQVAQVFKSLPIKYLNVSHRHPGIKEIENAIKLLERFPDKIVTPHISMRKLHIGKPHDITYRLHRWFKLANNLNSDHALVVSGYPRMKHDTLWALKELADKNNPMNLAVAYNPFLSDQHEEDRLQKKLQFPSVKYVYLQIGENPYYIERGVKAIREIRPDIKIFGCLLLPTPFVRNNLKESPWHGVSFSKGYLHNPIHAWEVTAQTKKIYQRLGITPLVEALPFSADTCMDYFHV